MFNRSLSSESPLPYKSVAAALLFCVILGPVGLLYATFWGGIIMIMIGIVVVSSKFFFPILLLWIVSCILGVRSVENYNQKIMNKHMQYQSLIFETK